MNTLARACASKSSLWWLTELIRRAILHADDPYEALLAADIAFSAQPLPFPQGGFDIRLADSEGIQFATEVRGRAPGPFQGPSGRWFTKRKDGSVAPLSAPEGTHPTRRWPRAPEDEPGPVDDLLELIREVLSENDYPWARQAALDLIEGRESPDVQLSTWTLAGKSKGGTNIWVNEKQQRRYQEKKPGSRGKAEQEVPVEKKPAEQENEKPAALPEKPQGDERTVEQNPESRVTEAIRQLASKYDTGDGDPLIPIHEIRKVAGDLSPEEFNSLIHRLGKQGQARLVPISDYRDATQEQLDASIPGVEETLFYLKPKGDLQKPEVAPAAPEASAPEVAPPAQPPAPQPQPAAPTALLLANMQLRNGLRMDPEGKMPFTGQATDNAGRRICYAAGIRTTCPGKDGKPPRGKPNVRPSIEQVTQALDAAYAGGTTEQIESAAQLMGQLRVVELQQLRKARGGKYNRVKPLILQAIQATYQPQQTATPAPEAAPEQQPPAPEPQQAAQQPPQAAPAPEPTPTPPAPAAQPQTPPQASEKGLLEAFQKLAPAGRGMVSFIDLQKATGLPTEQLHQTFARLQQEGVLSGVTLEGRHGVSPEEQAIALEQPGLGRVGYVTVRDEEKLKRALGGAQQPPGGQAAPQPTQTPPAPVAKPPAATQRQQKPPLDRRELRQLENDLGPGGKLRAGADNSVVDRLGMVAHYLGRSEIPSGFDTIISQITPGIGPNAPPALREAGERLIGDFIDQMDDSQKEVLIDKVRRDFYLPRGEKVLQPEYAKQLSTPILRLLVQQGWKAAEGGSPPLPTTSTTPVPPKAAPAAQSPPASAQPPARPARPARKLPPQKPPTPPRASPVTAQGNINTHVREAARRAGSEVTGGGHSSTGIDLIRELKKQGISKADAEKAILEMVDSGEAFIQRHDQPGFLTPEELADIPNIGQTETGFGGAGRAIHVANIEFRPKKGESQTTPTAGAGAPDRLSPVGGGSTPPPAAEPSVYQRAATGDVKAQNELLSSDATQAKIKGMVGRMLNTASIKDEATRADLAQQVNLKLLMAMRSGKLDPKKGNFEQYASLVTSNAVRDYFRKRRVEGAVLDKLKTEAEAIFREEGGRTGGQFSLGDGLSLNPAIARPAALELILDTLADSPAGPDGKPSDEAWGSSQQILDWLGEQDSQQEPLQLPDLLMIPEDARA